MVSEEKLEKWILSFKELLKQNDQESLSGVILGRLFSFSPIGSDGHKPCEAVRSMIEKYGDKHLIKEYQISVYNQRGIYSPSAGKAESQISENFKANAKYLELKYPMTAKIYYGLSDTFKRESERERRNAENGL